MRNLMWVAMTAIWIALPLGAAEPGGPDQGGPGPGGPPPGGPPMMGPGRGPGGPPPMMGPGGGMFGGQFGTEIFDAARKTLALPNEAKGGVDLLDAQFGDDLQAAIAEARLKLVKDYVTRVLALLPDEEKPKYEAVAKALTERDEALAAARKELRSTLDQVKTSQGADKAQRDDRRPRFGPPGDSLTSKTDVLRTHFVLTGQQQQALDENQQVNAETMRERMGNLFADLRGKGGPPDPNTFRRLGPAMTQIREQLDDETAVSIAEFFTPEQKKDYATACSAIDTCRKKTKAAEEACRTKIVEAVSEAKANALLGPPAGALPQPPKATGF